LNPNYDVINDVISGFAKLVVERCGFHHWIAQRISWGEMVSVFLCLLYFPNYDVINDVINDVIKCDPDCTPGREPRSVAASFLLSFFSSPNLSSRRLDVYHTSAHSVVLVLI